MVGLDPTGHVMHAADPVSGLYFPAVHRTHAAPSSPVCPAIQVQDESDGLLAKEKVLFGQCVQLVDPASEYVSTPHGSQNQSPVLDFDVPATHGTHAAPSVPV
jgi:hypothetical protein